MTHPYVRAALAAALLGAAHPLAAQRLHVDVKQKTLDNGVTVLVWERPSAGRIGTRIFYRVDVAAERPGTAGLTHMLEHHLFKGSDVSGTGNWAAERPLAEGVERLASLTAELLMASGTQRRSAAELQAALNRLGAPARVAIARPAPAPGAVRAAGGDARPGHPAWRWRRSAGCATAG